MCNKGCMHHTSLMFHEEAMNTTTCFSDAKAHSAQNKSMNFAKSPPKRLNFLKFPARKYNYHISQKYKVLIFFYNFHLSIWYHKYRLLPSANFHGFGGLSETRFTTKSMNVSMSVKTVLFHGGCSLPNNSPALTCLERQCNKWFIATPDRSKLDADWSTSNHHEIIKFTLVYLWLIDSCISF